MYTDDDIHLARLKSNYHHYQDRLLRPRLTRPHLGGGQVSPEDREARIAHYQKQATQGLPLHWKD